MVRLSWRRKHLDLALLRASPCLFQLGEHSGQQLVLRPQQELDRAEPLCLTLRGEKTPSRYARLDALARLTRAGREKTGTNRPHLRPIAYAIE